MDEKWLKRVCGGILNFLIWRESRFTMNANRAVTLDNLLKMREENLGQSSLNL